MIQDLGELLRSLQPVLNPGVYVYCVVHDEASVAGLPAVAVIREREGTTLIVEESLALARGLTPVYRAGWITLTVQSDLAAIGMTAAVARALTDAGISCNVVAAVHHDHLFVPVDDAHRALEVLRALARTVNL